MYGIVLIVIGALLAFINGDDSLLLAILKMIGSASLILGILFIFAYAPWLVLLIIIGLIIFVVYQSSSNNSTSNTQNNNVNSNSNTSIPNKNTVVNNPNLTGFKAELQNNTKTPKQVENEKWIREQKNIKSIAVIDYNTIKNQLLSKAKGAEYTVSSNKRVIRLRHECNYMMSCVKTKSSTNPSGRKYTNSYRENFKLEYWIEKQKEYDYYIMTMQQLAKEDGLTIHPVFVEVDTTYHKEKIISMPYTYTNRFFTPVHKIKGYLNCYVEY